MTDISKRLKKLRSQRNFTLTQVAERASVPVSSYQEWEQGRRILDVTVYFRLAELFGVSPRFLIFGKDTHPPQSEVLKKLEEVISDLQIVLTTLQSENEPKPGKSVSNP